MSVPTSEFVLGYRAMMLDSLAREVAITKRVLAAVPDGKRDYKPYPHARTAWELAWHIASTDERMGNCVYRQFDAVVHPNFAHHFRNVCLHGTLCNTERFSNFLVRKPRHQHFQNLFLTISDSLVGSDSHSLRLSNGKFYEHRKHPARNPD